MIKGLYSAASGMMNMLDANDSIANNMANINTPGFKQSVSLFQNFSELLVSKIGLHKGIHGKTQSGLGSISAGSKLSGISFDFTQGQVKKTDAPYDLAIQGNGFFEVQVQGNKRVFTRNGSFNVDTEGYLVTNDGHKVIGSDNNSIFIGKNAFDLKVDGQGNILARNVKAKEDKTQPKNPDEKIDLSDYKKIAQLKVVDFDNKLALLKVGNSFFEDPGTAGQKVASGYQIMQGALETANASPITTMVKTMEGMRTYETLEKIVETTNRNLEKVVNQLGKL